MFSFLKNLLNTNQKELNRLQAIVDQVNQLEPQNKKLKDDQFAAQLLIYKKQLDQGKTINDILPEIFALVREASRRTIGLRPYDVQLMAAIAMFEGKAVEQKTGEGKTLSAAPALILRGLTGKGAHLVTVNDYLARRDTGWMGPIYHLLGLSVGVIYSGEGDQPAAIYDPEYSDPAHSDQRLQHLKPTSRQQAYQADITYGTNNEFGFDYLRDNMARSFDDQVQREPHFAIVDEVDSILIDEARTPLIISAPDTEPTDKYFKFSRLIGKLSKDTDYEIDEKLRTAALTEHGLKKVEKILKIDNIYEKDFDTVHHIQQALKAKTLFSKDKDYVAKDGQVIIVDEHTGRLMYGRRYSEGLHQAIEAKENLKIQQESKTLATISLQNYFRMYPVLSGMTGTAATEADEFKEIYGLDVVVVPTNEPVIRKDHSDLVYKTTRAKYSAIIKNIQDRHEKGQPILIGTKSIDQNQILSTYLDKKDLPHQVLNAKNHEREAEIIARAGSVGAITVATNIAGRGVDIVLGGDPGDQKPDKWQKKHHKVIDLGGLHVIGAVRNESRRIDNQFRGRSGRQGDPGSSRFYVSLEDDIMRIFGGDQVSRLMDILKVPEDQPLEANMVSKAIETAQSKVESFHFDQRKQVVEYDNVVNRQREIIYARRQKLLQTAQGSPQKLRRQIKDILHKQIDQITTILAPQGITKDEINTLLQDFLTILPLDSASQESLRTFLQNNHQPNKINKRLKGLIDKAYQLRESQFKGEGLTRIEKQVTLSAMDRLWVDHLDSLKDLEDGIRLRAYAQKDPLVEYKQEAFSMFESLLSRINRQISETIFRVHARPTAPGLLAHAVAQKGEAPTPQDTPPAQRQNQNTNQPAINPDQPRIKPVGSTSSNIGRNDPCWCGKTDEKGKPVKWKKCHYPELKDGSQV